MDEILNYLQSPGWWFTTFVAAVVVAYLKDILNYGMARSFAWYRQWRADALAREERQIEFLTSDPTVLTLYNIRNVQRLVFSLSYLIMFFMCMWVEVIFAPTSHGNFLPGIPPLNPKMWILTQWITVFIGLVTTWSPFNYTSRILIVIRANARFLDRKKAQFEGNANPPEKESVRKGSGPLQEP